MKPRVAFFALVACVALAACADVQVRPNPAIAGHWQGTARLYYDWPRHKAFPVAIDIHPDGSVSGTIGNATLAGARFMRHRPLNRPDLKDLTEYMITGRLIGPMIAAEHITASNVFIPLDLTEGRFEGGVNAHGATVKGEPFGILSASLTLNMPGCESR